MQDKETILKVPNLQKSHPHPLSSLFCLTHSTIIIRGSYANHDYLVQFTKSQHNKPRIIAKVLWLLVESEWKSYGRTMLLTLFFSERFVKASSMTYKDQHQQANYREIHFQRHIYSIDLSRGKHFKDLANLILLGSFMLFPCGEKPELKSVTLASHQRLGISYSQVCHFSKDQMRNSLLPSQEMQEMDKYYIPSKIIERLALCRYNKPRIATANWLIVASEWKSYGWTMLLTLFFLEHIVKASSMTYKDQHQHANYRETHFKRHIYSIDLSRGKNLKDLVNLILLGAFMFFRVGCLCCGAKLLGKARAPICHVRKSRLSLFEAPDKQVFFHPKKCKR
ncbi:hypothetical protein NC652_029079 [Populus alba x Populus x berolinensis]|nr:hypothetical protein NC652_029079 [Populus alba x Populus x berolinensis]